MLENLLNNDFLKLKALSLVPVLPASITMAYACSCIMLYVYPATQQFNSVEYKYANRERREHTDLFYKKDLPAKNVIATRSPVTIMHFF